MRRIAALDHPVRLPIWMQLGLGKANDCALGQIEDLLPLWIVAPVAGKDLVGVEGEEYSAARRSPRLGQKQGLTLQLAIVGRVVAQDGYLGERVADDLA